MLINHCAENEGSSSYVIRTKEEVLVDGPLILKVSFLSWISILGRKIMLVNLNDMN